MKTRTLFIAAASVGLTFCISLPQPATARDALNFPDGILTNSTAYLNGGGVGWSFIPRTNLTVTEVGYLAGQELPDAMICIWAGTNGPIATFTNLTVPQPSSPIEVLFAPVPPLPLAAGEEYRITFHRGSWPDQYTTSTFQPLKLEDCGTEPWCSRFLPAPEIQFLTNYSFAGNVFTPQPDSARSGSWAYLGPTFQFELATPEKSPLQVLHDGAAFVLSWPASVAVSVEASDDLRSASWLEVTNGVVATGDSFVLTNSLSSSARFFRLRVK